MTEPYYSDERVTLHHGDCLDVLATMPDASVDAIVTDPPYGLEFMGKEWDAPWKQPAGAWADRDPSEHADQANRGQTASPFLAAQVNKYAAGLPFQQWCESWARECLRVLKPGGHLLAFGGTRTWHRLACAVEDAGFEMRDSIAWLYGSGFPKSMDVGKAIDKAGHLSRPRALEFTAWMRSTGITAAQINEATSSFMASHYLTDKTQPEVATADAFDLLRPLLPEVPERIERLVAERTGVTWKEYLARGVVTTKSAASVYADEITKVLDHGTPQSDAARTWQGWGTALKPAFEPVVCARKPLAGTVAANVLAHGTGALNIDGCRVGLGDERPPTGSGVSLRATSTESPYRTGDGPNVTPTAGRWPANVILDGHAADELDRQGGDRTSGVLAAHHVRNPKESGILGAYGSAEGERGYGDSGGASRFFPTFRYEAKAPGSERPKVGGTAHPTVKPLELMRWLVRLVTPPGGTVLDPFAGSGTTGEACVREGFRCVLIERETDYLPLIVQRLGKPMQLGLDFGGGVA